MSDSRGMSPDVQLRGILPRSPKNLSLYGIYIVATSVASLNITTHKFSNGPLASLTLGFTLLLLGGLLFTRYSRPLEGLLSSKAFWLACLLLLTVGDLARYPYQSRKPDFETAAPALIESAHELAHGHDPYLAGKQVGAPISAGPGWILLLMPLSLSGLEVLINPICAAACAYLLSRTGPYAAGLFVLLLLLQPNYLSQTTVGHDLFAIPLAFAALCLAAPRTIGHPWKLTLLAVLSAAFATARLPLLALLAILCLGIYRRDRRSGILVSAIAMSLTLLLHVTFYLWTRHDGLFYQPLHLIGRARVSGSFLTTLGLVSGSLVCIVAALRMSGQAKQWILAGALFLLAAFVPVAFGELFAIHLWFGGWEGGNYLSFGISLVVVALALETVHAAKELPQHSFAAA